MANWPSRIDYRLSEAAVAEVSIFAENAGNLRKIVDSVNKQAPMSDLQEITEAIARDVNIRAPDIRIILNSLENIKDLSADLGSYDEGLNRLVKAVSEDVAIKIESGRAQINEALRNYADDNAVAITIKAQRLTFSRQAILHDAEIFTDTRPIFDKSGTKIKEYIITQTLMLSVIVDGAFEQRYLSLDNADVINVRRACERAILKSKTLKDALGATGTPTVIVRDEVSFDP